MELGGTYVSQQEYDNIRNNKPKTNYKNGGITLPNTHFFGSGNRAFDLNNKSNFNNLPDNCLDWLALEHDAAYHNLGGSGKTKLYDVEMTDNIAIDNAWRECKEAQPVGTAVLIGGLKTFRTTR